jgi:hypothetical protein
VDELAFALRFAFFFWDLVSFAGGPEVEEVDLSAAVAGDAG